VCIRCKSTSAIFIKKVKIHAEWVPADKEHGKLRLSWTLKDPFTCVSGSVKASYAKDTWINAISMPISAE
jgi:hypothetical protein